MTDTEKLNAFFVDCFNSILTREERALEPLFGGRLSLKEIHVIEAIYQAKETGENNFSSVAKALGVTLGTLTASFSRLQQKGLLYKVRGENDKRVYYIEPTEKSEKINDAHKKFHRKMVEGIADSLSNEELNNLVGSLKTLSKFFLSKE